jgi:autotransporter-associated beta strand protein
MLPYLLPTARLPFSSASALLGVMLSAPAGFAASLTWDAGNTGNDITIDALSGEWNTTDGNIVWNNAGTNEIWSQTSTTDGSNAAIFAGTDGTLDEYVVALSAQMAAESLAFNRSGYQITGSPLALIVTPGSGAGTANGSLTVAAGKTSTINSQIVYNNNQGATITVGSGGILNLWGGATNSQYNFQGAGTVNMLEGAYSANTGSVAVSTFNQTGGSFNITPGNNVVFSISNNTRSVNYTISGTGVLALNAGNTTAVNSALNIGNNTAGTFTSILTVNGGTVNVGLTDRQGLIRISNTATSNGKLDIRSGALTVGTGKTTNQITLFENGASAFYSATMTQSGGTVTTNGIQFGGGIVDTYDASSSATLSLSGGNLYVGAAGITRGSAAATLPATILLEGGTLGASQAWTSAMDMKLSSMAGGPTIRAQNSGSTARNITLSGILSDEDAVNGTLSKTGSGTLTLSGPNTFSGGLTIVDGTVNATTNDTALGSGPVTMGGIGSTGATLITGRIHSNTVIVNAPDSGSVIIASNGGGSNYTLSGGITLNGDLTLQTFNNTISGVSRASGTLRGGITGNGNITLNNNGLAANAFNITTSAVNHTGSLTLQGTATGNTTISANIGSNVTGITQNSATSPMILAGANTYPGNLTVNAGLVRISNAPDPLNANTGNDASTVTLAESGATLDLTFTGTDIVDKLFIGATQLTAGVYGPSATAIPQITGAGTLTVLSGPPASSYASWATLNSAGANLYDDHDKDGVANGVEYFIGGPGGNTTGFTPLPNATNVAGVHSITWTKASSYTGIYGTNFVVETSSSLVGEWSAETLGGNVTISGSDVIYTFPAGTKNFARLKVTGP